MKEANLSFFHQNICAFRKGGFVRLKGMESKMTITISSGGIAGHIAAIPSKSHLHRLLICAALVGDAGKSTVLHFGQTEAEDIAATIGCLTALGAKIERNESGAVVTPIDLANLPKKCVLPCHESGSTLRFMLPVVCALGGSGMFKMAGRLPERPIAPLDSELIRHGIVFSRPEANLLCCEGRLSAGDYLLPGDVSSQYITGLLLALPLVEGDSRLTVSGLIESEDYISLTLQVCAQFGLELGENPYVFERGRGFVSPGEAVAEGDWSNAAFWLCAGAMPGGNVKLSGMKPDSTQGDKEVCGILQQMGASVSWSDGILSVVEKNRRGVEIDARAIPDLVPVLAAVAAVSEGVTLFKNAGRLRLKESDRLMTTAQTLNALGAKITEEKDALRVEGVPELTGGKIDACGDHRIAMMAAVASAACTAPVIITGAEAVNKSYPKFWDDIEMLCKKVTRNG